MISGAIFALQNLTRIYIINLTWDEKKFGRSTAYFPLVGLIIGIFLFAIYAVGIKYYPPLVVAALIMVAQLMVTGGMHLDGFMDSMDGLFSGRQRERKLEIMKDSRVGANGVMALGLLFLLKFSLLVSLVQLDDYFILAILILMGTLSRWSMVYAIKSFPYLTKEGLGTFYKKYTGTKEFLIATIITLIIVGGFLKLHGLILFLIVLGFTFLMARQTVKTIGGLTGDTYGAFTEMLEVIILLILLLL